MRINPISYIHSNRQQPLQRHKVNQNKVNFTGGIQAPRVVKGLENDILNAFKKILNLKGIQEDWQRFTTGGGYRTDVELLKMDRGKETDWVAIKNAELTDHCKVNRMDMYSNYLWHDKIVEYYPFLPPKNFPLEDRKLVLMERASIGVVEGNAGDGRYPAASAYMLNTKQTNPVYLRMRDNTQIGVAQNLYRADIMGDCKVGLLSAWDTEISGSRRLEVKGLLTTHFDIRGEAIVENIMVNNQDYKDLYQKQNREAVSAFMKGDVTVERIGTFDSKQVYIDLMPDRDGIWPKIKEIGENIILRVSKSDKISAEELSKLEKQLGKNFRAQEVEDLSPEELVALLDEADAKGIRVDIRSVY